MLRRTFLKSATIALNGVIGLGLAIPGVRFFFHPLRRTEKPAGFLPVTKLAELPVGVPKRVPVVTEQVDAFTRYASRPIGSVWLLREGDDGGQPKLKCWQVICPHLGCGIDFVKDRGAFACPCHASEFDTAGKRKYGPAPRDMDELECRVVAPNDRGETLVEVKYERFRTGLPVKNVV